MNRKELDTLIQQLRCSKCNDYLICPPVVQLEDGTSVCGNCTPHFPTKGPDGTLVRQQSLEYILRRLSFPCKFQPDGCEERLCFGYDNHNEEKCVHRPLPCPLVRCPWIGSMFDIHKHFAEVHSVLMKSALDFKLLVAEDSEETMVAVVDKVPFIGKYIYKAEQRKLAFIVNCLTLDEASYKVGMFNNLLKDYGVSVEREKCMPYSSLPCKGLILNLDKYLPAIENPECVLVKVKMIIEKGDENERASTQPAPAPTLHEIGNVVQLRPSFISLMRMTIPKLYTTNKGDVAGPNVPQ